MADDPETCLEDDESEVETDADGKDQAAAVAHGGAMIVMMPMTVVVVTVIMCVHMRHGIILHKAPAEIEPRHTRRGPDRPHAGGIGRAPRLGTRRSQAAR
jgi:hypothetical protein